MSEAITFRSNKKKGGNVRFTCQHSLVTAVDAESVRAVAFALDAISLADK